MDQQKSTTYAVTHEIRPEDCDLRSIPIGKPISNTRAYVLDRWLNPVPIGVVGELCLGGDGLAWGYIHQPVLSAEKFIPDPFGGSGGRLYRTGDQVRFKADGNLEFIGRSDQQIKIRGFRVEMGEIEAALHEHPSVSQAVVLMHEISPDDKRLTAYVVFKAGAEEKSDGLRQFLAGRLPDYMLPSPLDGNSKHTDYTEWEN